MTPEQLHKRALVADLHADTVLFMQTGRDMAVENKHGHIDIPRLIEGGVNVQLFTSFIDPALNGREAFDRANKLIALLHKRFSGSEDISICLTPGDLREVVAHNSIAAILAIENGSAINSELENVDWFYSKGVRCITLVHTKTHDFCSSSSDSRSSFDGLTEFGREVIGRMNDLGMIVDISHASKGAVSDALAASSNPIIASHSCAWELCKHDRNLTDEQIKSIADKGGMIGMNFCGRFLSDERNRLGSEFDRANPEDIALVHHLTSGDCSKDEFDAKSEQYYDLILRLKKAMKAAPVNVRTVVDHIDHMVKIGGIDAVGLGSDYDGIPLAPDQLEDCSKLPNITIELDRRGYKTAAIEKILGLNFMRLFEAVSTEK